MGEQVGGGPHDDGGAAVVDLEGVGGHTAVGVGQVDEHARGGPRIPVDRLVVVPDGEQLLRGTGEQPHEQHERGREVLRLVDEQVRAAARHPPAQDRVGEQQRDREVDLLVEVDGAARMQQRPVAGDDAGEVGDVAALRCDRCRVAQSEPDLAERGEHHVVRGSARSSDPAVRRDAQRVGDLRGTQHVGATSERGRADGQPEGVHGADAGPHTGDVHVPGALGQLLGRPCVVGQRGDQLRLHPAVLDEVTQPCGQHPRLARAGRGEHARRAHPVGDGRALRVAQRLPRGRVTFRVEPSEQLDALAMDADGVVVRCSAVVDRAARPAEDARPAAVRQDDVGGAPVGSCGKGPAAEPLRPHRRPPHRGRAARVDQVGEEERELVTQQPVLGSEQPQGPAFALRGEQPSPRQRRVEEGDAGATGQPLRAEALDELGECGTVRELRAPDVVGGGVLQPARDRRRGGGDRPAGRSGGQAAGSAS